MALERYVKAFEEQADIVATLDVGAMWARYLGEFLDRWTELERQGIELDEIEREMQAFIDGLSEKPTADLARKSSSVAYNQGRNAEILSAMTQGRSEWVIRSEVLDEKTCEPCKSLDGFEAVIGSPDFYEFGPPAKCEGGRRCRGFFIPVGVSSGRE